MLLTRVQLLAALLLPTQELARNELEARRQAAEDVQALKAARVPTEGPGLVRFLSRQGLAPAEKTRVEERVRSLGHKSFKIRDRAMAELLAGGPPVVPVLRRGLAGADLETARRLRRC